MQRAKKIQIGETYFMKKRKVASKAFSTVACCLFMVFSLFFSALTASADEGDIYIISGYHNTATVTLNGNPVSGHFYCLDSKENTPSGQSYTRYRLSEIPGYRKSHDTADREYTDEVKERLVKLLVAEAQIKSYVATLSTSATTARENIWAGRDDTTKVVTIGGTRTGVTTVSSKLTMSSNWNSKFKNDPMQALVWACVWDSSKWGDFIADDASDGDKADNYRVREKNSYGYISDDPVNDVNSLWNVFYKPVLAYIDALPNYYANGYDAWVYLTDNNSYQNMLGAAFRPVKLLKVDESGNPVAGTELYLKEGTSGAAFHSWVSSGTAYDTGDTITPDADKVYYLYEGNITDGYICADNGSGNDREFGFKVKPDGTIELQGDYGDLFQLNSGVLQLVNQKSKVNISKVDIAGSEELKGARIQILNADGTVASLFGDANTPAEWVSDGTKHVVTGLKAGTGTSYILHEVVAPAGYLLASDTTFTLDRYGNVTTSAPTTTGGVILIKDNITSVSISKKDIANSKELSGAKLQITGEADWTNVMDQFSDDDIDDYEIWEVEDDNGDICGIEWISLEDAPLMVKGLSTGVVYEMEETDAPAGYSCSENIRFRLDDDLSGNVIVNVYNVSTETFETVSNVVMYDKAFAVGVSKVEVTGHNEVIGAHIKIYDSDGKSAGEWDSDGTVHILNELSVNESYTLRETMVPDGYLVVSDTTFELDRNGKITTTAEVTTEGVILLEDAISSVDISKKAVSGSTELAGATLQITGEANWTNVLKHVAADDAHQVEALKDSAGVAYGIKWVSTDSAVTVKGLSTDVVYTLEEVGTPNGYLYSENIQFKLEDDKSGNTIVKVYDSDSNAYIARDKVEMFDGVTSVDISKKEVGVSGELAGATLQITGEADWTNVLKHVAADDAHQVEAVTDSTGTICGVKWISTDSAVTVKGLSTNVVYTMEETGAPMGYEYSEKIQFQLEDSKNGTTVVKVYDAKTKEYHVSDKVEMFDEAESSGNWLTSIGESVANALRLTKTGSYSKAPKTGEADTMWLLLSAMSLVAAGFGLLAFKKQ